MGNRRGLLCAWAALAAIGALAAADVVVQDASGRIYCRSQRFLIPFQAADAGPAGVSAVRLYYTGDNGGSWTFYGEKAEAKGSFEFGAPNDGTYGFLVDAVDRAGNAEFKDGPPKGTKPEITVVVDTKPPQIEAIFPRQDLQIAPGAHLRVRFRATDPNLAPSTAAICVKKDNQENYTELQNVTYQEGEFCAEGEVLWPGTYGVKLSVADRAGNEATTSFTFTCTPEAKPPVEETGPLSRIWEVPLAAPPRAKSLIFDIDYTVEEVGGQSPAAVGLWYTTDDGATWQFYGLDPDVTSPFRFQAPKEGRYGFKITATTRSGISEPAPKAGTKPDIVTLVDVTCPTLMLDDPRGGETYAGGEVHYIKWTAKDEHFGSLPISLYTARDGGGWELLASDLPNAGAYGWNVPFIEYATYRLKIEARDIVGNTTSVTSDNFYIVSAPPESRIRAVIPAFPGLGVKEVGPGTGKEGQPKVEETPHPQPPAWQTTQPQAKDEAEVKKLIDQALDLRMRGDYEGAEAALRQAVKLDTQNVQARNELGALLIQQGRQDAAVEVLKEARALAPKDTDVLYNLACAYYALGRYKDAADAYETLAGLDPTSDAALWNLAKAYFAQGEVTKARATWQRIVARNTPGSSYVGRARESLAAVPEPKKTK